MVLTVPQWCAESPPGHATLPDMKSGCKAVYMVTDMEGVAGVDDWDPRHADYANEARGVYDRSEIRRLLTGEVNAAAQGLLDAGVEEIVINDGHGAGRTILPEDLISGVRIARGLPRPSSLIGLSPRFDAMVQVGMHAMANTPHACLCHTMSKGYVYRLNGREVGEMQIAAYQAGEMGVAWIYASGDSHACLEAEEWVEGIVTAAVKEGLSEQCAIHLSPTDAWALIRETIAESVRQWESFTPLHLDPPVVLEILRDEPWPLGARTDAETVDAHTIRYAGTSVWQVMNWASRGRRDLPLPT